MPRAVAGIALTILVGAGLYWWRAYAIREDANHAIRGSGIIEVTEVDVAFEIPGTVAERNVDEGSLIDKGEPIARLHEREYLLQYERVYAAKAAAAARADLVLKGPRGREIDSAVAALDAAEAGLAQQQHELRRVQSLYENKVLSNSEFERISAAVAAIQAQRDQAQAQVDMLREGSRAEEIREARNRLQEAEKAVELAQLNLDRCRLFAPIQGRILLKSREVGETVAAGTPIVTIGDLSRPWLNLYVNERDLGRIGLGMKAQVMIDSFPQQPFEGKVTFIAQKSEFTPKNIQTQDERVKLVYRVKIELDNRDQALKPGMPADAVIPLNRGLGAGGSRLE